MPIAKRSTPSLIASGFTLIELLVVIAIVAILSAILFGAVGAMRYAQYKAQAASALRQWGPAFQSYVAEHNGKLPRPSAYFVSSKVWRASMVNIERDTIPSGAAYSLFYYLYPYFNPEWERMLVSGSLVKDARCPATDALLSSNPPDVHYIRTLPRAQWIGRDPFVASSPTTIYDLEDVFETSAGRIPLLSGLDRQNHATGSNEGGPSPVKALFNGQRAYLFFDGHVEFLDVPASATPGTEIVEGFRN